MQAPDAIPHVADADAVPTGEPYAYHVTRRRECKSICTMGITRGRRTGFGRSIDAQLHAHDADFENIPSNRSECVFLYPAADRPVTTARDSAPNCCFVVDLRQVTDPIYTADYDVASEMYADPEDAAAVARDYWASCRRYGVGDDAESELLIEGDVPPVAITHVFDP